MLLSVSIDTKTIGHKQLFNNLQFSIEAGEKVAIIGRNGVGKTTLFHMLTSEDRSSNSEIIFKKGTRVIATRQEHHAVGHLSVIDYILTYLPEYISLKSIIDTYPEHMSDNLRKIQTYSEALERFSALDYYTVEDKIRRSLADYQLEHMADQPLNNLSGGQKRFVELIRIEFSNADIALIDEPTNHMDYAAKAAFLKWFQTVKYTVVVITHDRDVLQYVDRIIEIKDMTAYNFPGNYAAYLKQNAISTTTQLHDYEVTQRYITNLKAKIIHFRRLKEKAGDPDTVKQFKRREQQATEELEQLQQKTKPTFWIDQESVTGMRPKFEASYQKHKAKTIHIQQHAKAERKRELLKLEQVSIGYKQPLFKPVDLRVHTGERVQIVGRNGAGKTTLVRTILECQHTQRPDTLLHGTITLDPKIKINAYEQEMSSHLTMTLGQAIESIYESYKLPVSTEKVMRTLSNYLFDPYADRDQPVHTLSGGQKARLQLIKMFANEPNVLILDEPTNHLDLPSIEELETVLAQYKGALLYISHDTYLSRHLGGEQLLIDSI